MEHLNVEFKARFDDLEAARATLRRLGATGPTVDQQLDTYFRVAHGRLKLREGSVEQALIHYRRPDQSAPKRSDVILYHPAGDPAALRHALTRALGVLAVVEKRREIWWLANVKLHLDEVTGLGTFIEVEAIAQPGIVEEELRRQCDDLLRALGVRREQFVAGSYSDMLGATA